MSRMNIIGANAMLIGLSGQVRSASNGISPF